MHAMVFDPMIKSEITRKSSKQNICVHITLQHVDKGKITENISCLELNEKDIYYRLKSYIVLPKWCLKLNF